MAEPAAAAKAGKKKGKKRRKRRVPDQDRACVWQPGEDPDETQPKKPKTDDDVSEHKEKVPEVSAVVTLPAQATRKCRAAPLTESAEETRCTTDDLPSKRPGGSALEVEMLQVGNMPCDTSTCLTKETLPLSYETIPQLSTRRNGKPHTKHVPDCIVALRPPIKEHTVPESTTSEVSKMGRPLCTAEEDVQRGEKEKYTQLLQLVKEKYPGSRRHPQLTRLRKVPAFSKAPVTTENHPEEEKHGGVYPCMTLRTSYNCADIGSPQLPQRSDTISYYTPAENSDEQEKSVKQATGTKQYGAELLEDTLLQFHLAPGLSRKPPGLDAEEEKFLSLEEPAEDFPSLTEAMEMEIASAFCKGNPDDIVSSAFKLNVTREDIHTLMNLQWLNDEVINFYMALLVERNKKKGFPPVHAFNTFFYPKLIAGGHAAVKRWTRGVNLFEQDLVFVPIHLRVHWALVVIDMRKKNIAYYDSMGKDGKEICETLFQYMQKESLEKRNVELALAEWTLYSMKQHEIPQQLNGSDCGVFMCQYANYLSRNKVISFTQTHMPYFRKKMVWEIIHQQLL